jgi:hypothetical protein
MLDGHIDGSLKETLHPKLGATHSSVLPHPMAPTFGVSSWEASRCGFFGWFETVFAMGSSQGSCFNTKLGAGALSG